MGIRHYVAGYAQLHCWTLKHCIHLTECLSNVTNAWMHLRRNQRWLEPRTGTEPALTNKSQIFWTSLVVYHSKSTKTGHVSWPYISQDHQCGWIKRSVQGYTFSRELPRLSETQSLARGVVVNAQRRIHAQFCTRPPGIHRTMTWRDYIFTCWRLDSNHRVPFITTASNIVGIRNFCYQPLQE